MIICDIYLNDIIFHDVEQKLIRHLLEERVGGLPRFLKNFGNVIISLLFWPGTKLFTIFFYIFIAAMGMVKSDLKNFAWFRSYGHFEILMTS